MPSKTQVAHDKRTGEYFLARVMYRDEACTDWFALQRIADIDEDLAKALTEPFLEHISSDEDDDEAYCEGIGDLCAEHVPAELDEDEDECECCDDCGMSGFNGHCGHCSYFYE